MRKYIKKGIEKSEVLLEGMLIAGLIYTVVLKRAWSGRNERNNARSS